MKIDRIVPVLTVGSREELEQAVAQHVEVLGMTVLMDHGGSQHSAMIKVTSSAS